jgi:hypothetical protein
VNYNARYWLDPGNDSPKQLWNHDPFSSSTRFVGSGKYNWNNGPFYHSRGDLFAPELGIGHEWGVAYEMGRKHGTFYGSRQLGQESMLGITSFTVCSFNELFVW